jgi:hypothetical protein
LFFSVILHFHRLFIGLDNSSQIPHTNSIRLYLYADQRPATGSDQCSRQRESMAGQHNQNAINQQQSSTTTINNKKKAKDRRRRRIYYIYLHRLHLFTSQWYQYRPRRYGYAYRIQGNKHSYQFMLNSF